MGMLDGTSKSHFSSNASVTKIISLTIMNLVTHNAGANHELSFNILASAFVC